jgi:hypothetical protein
MSAEGIIAVSAAVVALVQLIKWAGLRDSWGPVAVIALSVVGVMVWLVSGDSWPPARTDVWPIFSGIIAVTLSAAGVFGFTRATASAVTSISAPPPDGAGSSPTVKSGSDLTQADKMVGALDLAYTVLHDGHPAFTALVPASGHEVLDASEARHLDGRPIVVGDPVVCDRCGAALASVASVGGQWVAQSKAA